MLATIATAMTVAQNTAAASISPAATGKALRHLEKAGTVRRHQVSGNAARRWHDEWRITDTNVDQEEA